MSNLMACHECDLLTQLPPLPPRGSAHCPRCGCVLLRSKPNSIERTLALTFACLVLYCVAVSFPFLALDTGIFVQQSNLLTGVQLLYAQGMSTLATIVLLTCLIFPLLQMLGLLYVLLPLQSGRRLPAAKQVFRVIQHLKPWNMIEVFMIGVLVALVKLIKLAAVVPGISLWAFALLIFLSAALNSVLDTHLVWERLDDSDAAN